MVVQCPLSCPRMVRDQVPPVLAKIESTKGKGGVGPHHTTIPASRPHTSEVHGSKFA